MEKLGTLGGVPSLCTSIQAKKKYGLYRAYASVGMFRESTQDVIFRHH